MRAFPASLVALGAFAFAALALWKGWSSWWTAWSLCIATCASIRTTLN